ncbi:MAG: c-type cytochrome [Candidatus Solibacter sp.]|nr:c-type cytochrome [Candidatus Solibacter sp.]
MFWITLLLMAQAAVPSQTERGETLFLAAQQGCGSCHALKGKGTAVGPDLTGLGRLGPQAIAMATRSSVTQYVQVVKLKSGGSFPAMTGKKDEKTVVLFDLSKDPPEKKEVAPADIASMGSNDVWKHPPAADKISAEKLADIVAYIKYAATGSRKAVDPEEVK